MNEKLAKWVENWYLFNKPMFEVEYSIVSDSAPYKLTYMLGGRVVIRVGRKWLESRAEEDLHLAEILYEMKVEEEL